MERIGGIVFDKDGTLFDFAATWSVWARELIADEAGGDPARMARLAEVLGYDLAGARFLPGSPVIAHTTAQIAALMLPLLPGTREEALIARMNDRAALAPQVEATPLLPLIERLKGRGLRLGVATNDAEAPARAHLAASGVAGHFDFIAGFDSGHGAKPGPGQLLAFCAATGVVPERCAMVGDSLHDLHAARAAGMVAVGVLTGPAARGELVAVADVILGSVGDLPDWLGL